MKLYMAGPLFSAGELWFNKVLANTLRAMGHQVFLPQEEEQGEDPTAIFNSDVKGIDWAEAVVACLDGPDPDSGTCWELGYAYAKGKGCVVYRTDFRLFEGVDKVNLMMLESADAVLIKPRCSVTALAGFIHNELMEL